MHNELLDDHSELEPPDPIPNSEVKRLSADGSVGFPHVRVGHRQALKSKAPVAPLQGLFLLVQAHVFNASPAKEIKNFACSIREALYNSPPTVRVKRSPVL